MKKIGISTVYTGYNYGSALQTFAGKMIWRDLGYSGVVLHLGGSLIRGRDVRISKLLMIALRTLRHPIKARKSVNAYANSIAITVPREMQHRFDGFVKDYICPVVVGWQKMKSIARQTEYHAFVCGSDQIWNGDVLYVDPQYYLRYAPAWKRIAFAPSFGRFSVADYNKKLIGRYIKDIPYLSVREQSGVTIVKEIAGREAICLQDPTLYFDQQEWRSFFKLDAQLKNEKRYLLAYFLNEPSEVAVNCIRKIAKEEKLEVIALPYGVGNADWFDSVCMAGPIEFVDAIANASFVCTDSFHGTAFSLIMQVPFYTFERQYGVASEQSARILSLLDTVKLSKRYQPTIESLNLMVDFQECETVLKAERSRTREFLLAAIGNITGSCGGT